MMFYYLVGGLRSRASYRCYLCHELHEVVLPGLVPVLVACARQVLVGEEVVVGVGLLVLFLLALLGDAGFLLFLLCKIVRQCS